MSAAVPASAILREPPLEWMVEASDAIVIGEVTDARAVMLGREAVTLFTIEVDEMLKGEPRESMTLMLPGGMVPDAPVPIARVAADVPRMQVGDEGMWFLTDGFGGMGLTDFGGGFMPIVEGPFGDRWVGSAQGAVAGDGGAGDDAGLAGLMREGAPPRERLPAPRRRDVESVIEPPGVPLEWMRARILDMVQ